MPSTGWAAPNRTRRPSASPPQAVASQKASTTESLASPRPRRHRVLRVGLGVVLTVLPTSAHLDTIRRYAKSLGAKLVISFEWPDKTIEIG